MPLLTRRLFGSLNFLATLALLGVLFIMVNYLSSRRYARWDVSRQQLSVLSDQTLQVLKSLEEPVEVIVFYQPTHTLYPMIKDTLSEYQRHATVLHVEYLDPQRDFARARQLVERFAIEEANIVVFAAGTRHQYVSDDQVATYDYTSIASTGEPRLLAFTGEAAFTSALLGVTQAEQQLAWFTYGHGEKSVERSGPDGLSELKRYLEQQNLRVESVNLITRDAIAPDVKLLVIPGPTHPLLDVELEQLRGYLDGGGRVLILIDPLTDTALEPLLSDWGMLASRDIAVDPTRQLLFGSAADLILSEYATSHPITQQLQDVMTMYPLARSVQPAEQPPEGITVTPLAFTSESGWGESNPQEAQFERQEGQDLLGPVAVASAAERSGEVPARLVAFGDSDFLSNAHLAKLGNRDIALGAVYWLIEQEQLIGIGPKTFDSIQLQFTGAELRSLFWFSLLTMPLVCLAFGVGVWWFRRT